jgi:hypothetical protein
MSPHELNNLWTAQTAHGSCPLDSVRRDGHRHADAPGPDSMLVVARGIGQGRLVALLTVLGMTVGAGMVQLPLLALGVSSLVRASPFARRKENRTPTVVVAM